MSDRPTPEQIADALDSVGMYPDDDAPEGSYSSAMDLIEWLTDRLRSGAVIVHPSDYLSRVGLDVAGVHSMDSYNQGRGDLHYEIFGGGV